MNAVGVEYEKKFVDQSNQNIKHIQKTYRNKNLGKAVCIQGDARDLSCLKNVNAVLFSPPYFNALKRVMLDHTQATKEFLTKSSQTEEMKGTRKFHALKSHEYVLVFRKS